QCSTDPSRRLKIRCQNCSQRQFPEEERRPLAAFPSPALRAPFPARGEEKAHHASNGFGFSASSLYSLIARATSLAVSLPSAASAATAACATWKRSTSKWRRRLAR